MDCGAARMSVGSFTDDAQRTLLATLLAHCRPAEVVVEKGALSSATVAAIRSHRSGARCHGRHTGSSVKRMTTAHGYQSGACMLHGTLLLVFAQPAHAAVKGRAASCSPEIASKPIALRRDTMIIQVGKFAAAAITAADLPREAATVLLDDRCSPAAAVAVSLATRHLMVR